jgi:hypothetical protein
MESVPVTVTPVDEAIKTPDPPSVVNVRFLKDPDNAPIACPVLPVTVTS